MSILAECPICHRKQSVRNKLCSCGEDLVKAKRGKDKVRYWISYYLPNGKQRRESVAFFNDLSGYSIEGAKKAEAKRKVQKVENQLMDIKPEAKITFRELADWFLSLEKVKSKTYFPILKYNLSSFNSEFGDLIVRNIKLADLENYQAKRKKEGYSDSYIDQQIGAAKRMINKAFSMT